MMKTKTIKTPLMMAEAYSLSCWPSILVSENKFSHGMQVHPGLVPRLCHHGGKTIVLRTQKPIVAMRFFSGTKWNGVFPLMMSIVAKQLVLMAGLVRELAHRHRAVTAAQMLEE